MTEEVVRYAKEKTPMYQRSMFGWPIIIITFANARHVKAYANRLVYYASLNEIDAALTELGLQTKLVFLIYFELLLASQDGNARKTPVVFL